MLYGADVSAFQEGFDFGANASKCPFVIIKQTEGLTWPEQNDSWSTDVLREMRRDAQASGYTWVGLYHFARPSKSRTGRQEAEHFISFVGELHPNEGVVLDYEANNGLSSEELEDFALDFVTAIEEKWPSLAGNVVFYSYPDFLANMSTDRLVSRCPLWLAAYGKNDGNEHPGAIDLDRWPAYTFWQFTSNGRSIGWDGELDLNRFESGETELAKLGVGTPGVVDPPVIISNPVFVPEAWPGEYLRRGSSGIRVVQIQQRLARRGWRIGIDGEFGRETDTVVRKFQAEKGLVVDGIVGKDTWDAMYAFFEGVDVWPTPVDPTPPLPDPPPNDNSPIHPDPAGWCAAMGFDGNAGLDPVREFQRAFAFYPISVDGSAGPQTARAVQVCIDNGDKLSPHFSIDELRCKHCGRIRFLRQTLECTERARERVGPINAVSAYRCPIHNAAIGGATDSQHMMGAAIDINIPVSVAEDSGYTGIGTCGDDCLHGDDRADSGNNTTGASPGNPTYWSYC